MSKINLHDYLDVFNNDKKQTMTNIIFKLIWFRKSSHVPH